MKISVITVSLNMADTIERTIKSVTSQECDELEYIVIDGGSDDGTVDIIRKYAPDISYWCSEPDNGIYDAMNKGLTVATGDIVAFLNSDDWYEENALKTVTAQFDKETDVLCGQVKAYKEGQLVGIEPNRKISCREWFLGMCYCHQAIFARRQVFEAYGGFDTRYRIAADYDWFLNLYVKGIRIKVVDFVLANYNKTGISNKRLKTVFGEFYEIGRKALSKDKQMGEDEKRICISRQRESYRSNMAYAVMNAVLESACPDEQNALEKLLSGNRYIIFGTGMRGEQYAKLLLKCHADIQSAWDNNEKLWGTKWNSLPVDKPCRENVKNSMIIVTSARFKQEMVRQLKDMGLKENDDYMYGDDLLAGLYEWNEGGFYYLI